MKEKKKNYHCKLWIETWIDAKHFKVSRACTGLWNGSVNADSIIWNITIAR